MEAGYGYPEDERKPEIKRPHCQGGIATQDSKMHARHLMTPIR